MSAAQRLAAVNAVRSTIVTFLVAAPTSMPWPRPRWARTKPNASAAHLASWNGTAPIDASSGDQVRHRLSRGGNRQVSRTLHMMAVVQLRKPHRGSRRAAELALAG
jgi:Transposase IS116/IS110/IS902 family